MTRDNNTKREGARMREDKERGRVSLAIKSINFALISLKIIAL